MAVTGLCGHRNLCRLHLRLIPARELFAGTTGKVTVVIKNHNRRLPVFLLRVHLADAQVLVPAIPPMASVHVDLPLRPVRRGYQPLPAIRLSSCFPVNFFVRTWQPGVQQSVLVFPRPLAAVMPAGKDSLRALAALQLAWPGGDGDLRNIANYQRGDSLKAIHWKLSARHQELKTRQLNRQAGDALIFDLHQFTGSLEERLGRCTYLINRCIGAQRAVGLRLGRTYIAPQTGRRQQLRLLKELALYD
ncbi:MAG: DUF58 domain-containing protein [Pelovirga sp.]